MAGCRLCGCPTSRRLCRQCEIEERAEERAQARKRAETDDEDTEGDESELSTDGGYAAQAASSASRVRAERQARQAARSLDYWSREARVDLLDIVQDETPVRFGLSKPISSQPANVQPGPTVHLVCRDCPFEGISTGKDAHARLDRAKEVHRTAFGHETVVEQVDSSSGTTSCNGGSDR